MFQSTGNLLKTNHSTCRQKPKTGDADFGVARGTTIPRFMSWERMGERGGRRRGGAGVSNVEHLFPINKRQVHTQAVWSKHKTSYLACAAWWRRISSGLVPGIWHYIRVVNLRMPPKPKPKYIRMGHGWQRQVIFIRTILPTSHSLSHSIPKMS